MPDHISDDDLELLNELGVDTAPTAAGGRSAREQRIIAGFEEIERFVAERGHAPQHGEGRDIFERMYAVRLDRLRGSPECRELLKCVDVRGIVDGAKAKEAPTEELSDEDLLASLEEGSRTQQDITRLVHVRSQADRRAAEEISRRDRCEDFEVFEPVFERVQKELLSGKRRTTKYKDDAEIRKGDLFIVDGQKALVAEVGDLFVAQFGREDRRLRVVYDNGTQNEMLGRSLMRALNRDKSSRRIIEADSGPLFSDIAAEGDMAAGYVYVLRSKSDHPFVAQHRAIIHKIGITAGDVASRVTGAKNDPTYLLADVELVGSFKLANINRAKLEALLHRFFGAARLDLELKDRFGSQVEPREWFLVPLSAIDQAVRRIVDGSIDGYRYDAQTASVVPITKLR